MRTGRLSELAVRCAGTANAPLKTAHPSLSLPPTHLSPVPHSFWHDDVDIHFSGDSIT